MKPLNFAGAPWSLRSAVCLGGLLALVACSKTEPAPEPVRAVKVMQVGASALQAEHEYAGEVRARIESRLGFRVSGKLLKRHVELGQHVRAGQLLAEIDPQDYRLAVDAAQAQVAAALTNRDLQGADLKRYQELKAQGFIGPAELDRRDAGFRAAQAQLEQAQAQLAGQKNQLAYTRLLADAPGVVTGVEAEPGQVVSAGTPVLRVAQDGLRDAVFAVPEDRIAAVRVGAAMQFRVWGQERWRSATVREVAASADPVTRTFQAKVGLPERDAPALGATLSLSAQTLPTQGVQAIKLPTSALRQEGGQTAVWVLDKASMSVQSQNVQIATAEGNEAVVAAGLQPGQWVVTAGVHVLSPKQKVTLYQAPASSPGTAAK